MAIRGRKELKRYSVILEDGASAFIGTIYEITALVKQRPGTEELTANFIQDRVHYLSSSGGTAIPIAKLTCKKNSLTEKATKSAEARAQRFNGVEGFDRPVSAREVWHVLVIEAGKTIPTKHTIHSRLVRGLRGKDALLHGNKATVGGDCKIVTPALSEWIKENRPRPLVPDIVRPRIWGQGGKPYYRPNSLWPWPELERALMGGSK